MNHGRIVWGGIVGGALFSGFSILVNVVALGERYRTLQQMRIFHAEPRLPFLPLYVLLLVAVSTGLVWLYAAARPRLGPGPATALKIGLVVGLIGAAPHALAMFSWTHHGGIVTLWQAIESVGGSLLAALGGAWIYRE